MWVFYGGGVAACCCWHGNEVLGLYHQGVTRWSSWRFWSWQVFRIMILLLRGRVSLELRELQTSSVGLQWDCPYLLWKLFIVRVDSGDSLPAHNCCSCVGELETKWRCSSAHSRHLGIRLIAVLTGFQIPYMCETLSHLLPFDDTAGESAVNVLILPTIYKCI